MYLRYISPIAKCLVPYPQLVSPPPHSQVEFRSLCIEYDVFSVLVDNDVTQVMTENKLKLGDIFLNGNSSSIVPASVCYLRSSCVLCEFIFFLELRAMFLWFVIV